MIPESRLIRSEIIIRDLFLSEEVLIARKSLVRWLALSLGLIMPNESRKLLLDIFEILLEFHFKNQIPTTKDILLRMLQVFNVEPNPKAVYYHLQRLISSGLITRKKGKYYFGQGEGQKLSEILRELYLGRIDKSFSNINKVIDKLQNAY